MIPHAVPCCAVLWASSARPPKQISRLTALLEASRLHAALSSEQLMADLADERMRSERLRAVRDDALMER